MITLTAETANLIKTEMESIPEKYQKPFNSGHEGYAVLLEEVEELKDEIFFGEKRHKKACEKLPYASDQATEAHRKAIRAEAVQVAAMACRIIQELT